MSRGRYRWRTELRRRLPYLLANRIPKGPRDCGQHDWYNADGFVEHCYHCAVGVRPRSPTATAASPKETSARSAVSAIKRSFGFYDPAYIPRFARRLRPPPRRCLLAVKGWFVHSSLSAQREPWHTVEVWCDGKLLDVLTQGLGRQSRLVTSLKPGDHDIEVVGNGLKRHSRTVLRQFHITCEDGAVHYIAFVPPRPNPFARKPKPHARWFVTWWTPDE